MASLPDLGCACANLRRAARLVTQLYAREMGAGLEPTQFALLTALAHSRQAGQSGLGRVLGLDKTTLSRNLKVMLRHGWIEPADSDDRRERGYRLTPEGEQRLAAAGPGWRRAQQRLRTALTPGEWEQMQSVFGRVAEAAHTLLRDAEAPSTD